MRKLIGALIEIETRQGLSYALCTHRHEEYHYLLRIFSDKYQGRPEDISGIVLGDIQFSAFFPLGVALRKGIFDIAGYVDIPSSLQEFPLFRTGFYDKESRKVLDWSLWDGESSYRVGKLSEKQKKYPVRGVWNDTLLISRIESGYTSEADPST